MEDAFLQTLSLQKCPPGLSRPPQWDTLDIFSGTPRHHNAQWSWLGDVNIIPQSGSFLYILLHTSSIWQLSRISNTFMITVPSNNFCSLCVCPQSLSHVQFFVTPWTAACQAMGILQARILEWVAMLPPGDLPNPVIKLRSPAVQEDSLPSLENRRNNQKQKGLH